MDISDALKNKQIVLDTIRHMRDVDKRSWEYIAKAVNLSESAARARYDRDKAKKPKANNPETKKSYHKETGTNTAESSSVGSKPYTLDEMIEMWDIDTEVWTSEPLVTNVWDVAAKFGKAGDERMVITNLWQTKVHWKRIKPIAVKPVLHTITSSDYKPAAHKKPKTDGIGYALIFSDPQFGFWKNIHTGTLTPMHSREAMDVILQVATHHTKTYGAFDQVVIAGDLGDFSMWSTRYLKEPEFHFTSQPMVIEGHWWLRQLVEFAPVKILAGNHDVRPEKLLKTHLIDAFDLHPADDLAGFPLMSVPRMFGMDSLGIEYIENYPDGQIWLNKGIAVEHGNTARAGGGATVTAITKESDHSKITGHTHRMESASKTRWNVDEQGRRVPRIVRSISFGCACALDNVPAAKKRQDWQHGAGIVQYERGGVEFQDSPIAINNGIAMYDGRIFTAKDRSNQLTKMLEERLKEI